MTKILVTGGAGYIGSILVPLLTSLDYVDRVTVLDNFMYNQQSLLDCCHKKNLTVVRGNARDKRLLRKLLPGHGYIFPLACLTGAPLCQQKPEEARATIVGAIKTILALREDWQKIIYPTTNSGYGIGQNGILCDENTPLNPISLYGKLKVEAEKMILDSGNSITLRLATAFGISPRMRLDLLVNDFVYRAVNDRALVLFEPHFKRNFIHVRDIAEAFVFCMFYFEMMKGWAYNVGLSDANLSKWELCGEIKKQVPDFVFTEAPFGKDPDQRNYIVSNAWIEALGFKPKISLQEGITELIKGFQIIRRNQFSNV